LNTRQKRNTSSLILLGIFEIGGDMNQSKFYLIMLVQILLLSSCMDVKKIQKLNTSMLTNEHRCSDGSLSRNGKCVNDDLVQCQADVEFEECKGENGVGTLTLTSLPENNCELRPVGACVLTKCDDGFFLNVEKKCIPREPVLCVDELSAECSIANGTGVKTRTCSNGVYSSFGECVVQSCNDGFVKSGNSCVQEIPVLCVDELSAECSIANGTGVKTRTCSNGVYSSFGECNVLRCNEGFVMSGNSCVQNSGNQGGGFSQNSGAVGVPRSSDINRAIGLFENPTNENSFTGNLDEITYYTAVYPIPPNVACGSDPLRKIKIDDSQYQNYLAQNGLAVEITPIGAKYNGRTQGTDCVQHVKVRLPIERLSSGTRKRIDILFDQNQSSLPGYIKMLDKNSPEDYLRNLTNHAPGRGGASTFEFSSEIYNILSSTGIIFKIDYQEELRLGLPSPQLENKSASLNVLNSAYEVISSSSASMTIKMNLRMDTFAGIFYLTFFHKSPVVEVQGRLVASNWDGNPRVVYHINELEFSSNIPLEIHSRKMIGARKLQTPKSGFAVTYDFIDLANKIEMVDSQGFGFFGKLGQNLTTRSELDLSLGTSTNWNRAGRGWAFLKDPHVNNENGVNDSISSFRNRVMGEMTTTRLAMEDISAIGCAARPGIPGGQACFSAYVDLPSYMATLDPLMAQFHVSSVHAEESHRPGFFVDNSGQQILDFPIDGPSAVYLYNGIPKSISLNYGAKQEFVNRNWPDGRSKINNGFTGYDKQHFSVTHLAMSYLLSGKESLMDQINSIKLSMTNQYLPASMPINGNRTLYNGSISAMRAPGRVLESLFSLHQVLDDQSFIDHMMVWFNDRIYSEYERVQNFRYPFLWRGGYPMCGETYIGYSSWMMGIMFNGLWAAFNLTGDIRIKQMLERLYPTYIETNFRQNSSGDYETAYRVHPNNYNFFDLTESNFADPCRFDGINTSPMGTVLWSFTATSLAEKLDITQDQKDKARSMYLWLNNHERWTSRGSISDSTVWFTPAVNLWE
jgi:hypothetical protein